MKKYPLNQIQRPHPPPKATDLTPPSAAIGKCQRSNSQPSPNLRQARGGKRPATCRQLFPPKPTEAQPSGSGHHHPPAVSSTKQRRTRKVHSRSKKFRARLRPGEQRRGGPGAPPEQTSHRHRDRRSRPASRTEICRDSVLNKGSHREAEAGRGTAVAAQGGSTEADQPAKPRLAETRI